MVYVDALTPCLPNSHWPYNRSCHMFADTEEELHRMAKTLGLKRAWYQYDGRLPHYDLTAGKRHIALTKGCIEVSRRFVGERLREKANE